MIDNPAFRIAAEDLAVTALLGTAPVRLYPFGEAESTVVKPYAVWQTVYGSPFNLLNEVPREDHWGVQIDCYALTIVGAHAVAKVLREAYEPHGYVVSYNSEFRESDTRLYRVSFTVEFHTSRSH